MNITNSNVNKPDPSQRQISICCPLVDGANMDVLMVGGNRSTWRKPMQSHGEHAKVLPQQVSTLLMSYEWTWIQTQDLLAVRQQS